MAISSGFAALASDGSESDSEDRSTRSSSRARRNSGSGACVEDCSSSSDDEVSDVGIARGLARSEAPRIQNAKADSNSEGARDCARTEDIDVETLRDQRGVVLRVLSDDDVPVADLFRPVLRFSDLAACGVPASLVAACQSCARGAAWTTAIQSEIWGLLLTPPGQKPSLRAPLALPGQSIASSAAAAPRPEDISVPDSDDDDLLAPGTESKPQLLPLPCTVRDDVDVIGVAPTGSGKTIAFLLPMLVDGLCSKARELMSASDVFCRFSELFSQSFPPGQGHNDALLRRLQKIHVEGDMTALRPALVQVAAKAASSGGKASVAWQSLLDDVESFGLLEPEAVVLSPTRELAQQVGEVGIALGAACAVIVGGVDHIRQRESLLQDAPALIVATPGRLLALCGQWPSSSRSRQEEKLLASPEAVLRLRRISRLVLDEADRLLDEGFEDDIQSLTRLAGRRRQTMMFSATWSSQTESLASALRPGAVHISVAGVPTSIEQHVELLPKAARSRRLREILRELGSGAKVLLFVLFKKEARELAKMLTAEGILAWALEGSMSQSARFAAMQGFRDTGGAGTGIPCTVLVATDVAARGLDVPDVSHVINFSFGLSPESYVHRIGRCGRAGRRGKAFTFVTEGDERFAGPLLTVLRGAGQKVPPGLVEMAERYEWGGGSEKLSVRWDNAGEVKVTAKGGRGGSKARGDRGTRR
mmetsp:Transcript_21786/g.61898  ORF Transcript_21786/g.61898 Transcript_21786/m.61898 type:complete len:705 (-) Transcript_21786:106-2220(-)